MSDKVERADRALRVYRISYTAYQNPGSFPYTAWHSVTTEDVPYRSSNTSMSIRFRDEKMELLLSDLPVLMHLLEEVAKAEGVKP